MDSSQSAMEIVFWGTRGSYPVPGPTTLVYGGNTACHSVTAGGRTVIIDAGTGIIKLGREMVKEKHAHRIALFLSHNHLDHTSGLLYFIPTYMKSTHMNIYGPTDSHSDIGTALDELSLPPAHPVALKDMGMKYITRTVDSGDRIVWAPDADDPVLVGPDAKTTPDDVVVSVFHNPHHPVDGVLNYRIDHRGKSYVYATDVEGDVDNGDPELAAFAAGCDLLAHDCQYTDEDYAARHRGWGHSTPRMAVKTALMAGAKRLTLVHFEPTYDDELLARMEEDTRVLFPNSFFAKEGMKIII